MATVRPCRDDERAAILAIVNAAAEARADYSVARRATMIPTSRDTTIAT